MERTQDEFESDWVHAVFDVFREEAVSIAADFGARIKREIDVVAATQSIRPPSATALLASVALETGNIAGSLLRRSEPAETNTDLEAAAAVPASESTEPEEDEND